MDRLLDRVDDSGSCPERNHQRYFLLHSNTHQPANDGGRVLLVGIPHVQRLSGQGIQNPGPRCPRSETSRTVMKSRNRLSSKFGVSALRMTLLKAFIVCVVISGCKHAASPTGGQHGSAGSGSSSTSGDVDRSEEHTSE